MTTAGIAAALPGIAVRAAALPHDLDGKDRRAGRAAGSTYRVNRMATARPHRRGRDGATSTASDRHPVAGQGREAGLAHRIRPEIAARMEVPPVVREKDLTFTDGQLVAQRAL
jgi:hypothetical protein